ncbi:RNA-binding domain-containing protein [Sporormia fimetaria CBS 119925]|uniref:RNA-binding domain-containing protein n=1 Tax=Sporormia fimetaria CBS 119925 TaxID=1340428 RepID=A0A6A6VC68_9PLEO|nr:RNA-binding domain-containing protein [Sporormia fimetaria CBS 119925]
MLTGQIVVENLTKNVNEGHLYEIFGNYGRIKDLKLPMNPVFNTNRGTAYILYEEIDDAERAIAKMHEAQLDGAKINVSIVLPRRRFSRSPPRYRQGPPPRDRDPYDTRPGGGPPGSYRPPPMSGRGGFGDAEEDGVEGVEGVEGVGGAVSEAVTSGGHTLGHGRRFVHAPGHILPPALGRQTTEGGKQTTDEDGGVRAIALIAGVGAVAGVQKEDDEANPSHDSQKRIWIKYQEEL